MFQSTRVSGTVTAKCWPDTSLDSTEGRAEVCVSGAGGEGMAHQSLTQP